VPEHHQPIEVMPALDARWNRAASQRHLSQIQLGMQHLFNTSEWP
jgi:hypothetical protein